MQILNSLQVQTWAVDKLILYARNARTHSDAQVAQIAGSIAEFGFNNPVLIDPQGGLIAGHGRVLAARQLGLAQVPVIVLAHLTENQKRAFRLADNKLALNAGWDEEMLRLELQALAQQEVCLELTGFVEQELTALLAEWGPTRYIDPDEAPRPELQAITVEGEKWRLGEHTVVCGDGTRGEVLQRVLAGERCHMVFTDPPYNVDYTGKTAARLKIVNDDLGDEFGTFLHAACHALLEVSAGAVYICMSSSELHRLHTAFTDEGGHWSTFVLWAKDRFTLGRSDYQRQYEPILYGWKEGAPHYWCGDRNQGDVWFFDKPRANPLHPTMKPVDLIERAIRNSSTEGQLILDPFAGSGSTVIACENTRRRARVVEIEPRYVDVILKRWQAYTGREAYREPDGVSFTQLAAQHR